MQTPSLAPLSAIANPSQEGLNEQIKTVHQAILAKYPCVDRVALASYDPPTDTLKTFISSNTDGVALRHYEARLSEVPSLASLVASRQTRIIADLEDLLVSASQHTQWLKERHYRSSLTIPVFNGQSLAAILFFDSKSPQAFHDENSGFLELIAHLLARLYLLQLQVTHQLNGAVQIATSLARTRDLETGQHLARMAAYSRLMASKLADTFGLSDEHIEYIHLFAPLHDIGKIGIPDQILLKPGKLTDEEWLIMRRHVEIGETIATQMGRELQLSNGNAFNIMRNIIACHHERGDGSGYPRQLLMAQIPIEARIVSVADVYDALTTQRPYKPAWTQEAVIQELRKEAAAQRLDPACVEVLLSAADECRAIQLQFSDKASEPHSIEV